MKKIILFIILILTCIFNVKAQFAPDYSVSKAVISPLEVKAFDLNGDGNLDVLTASNFGAELTWSENLGNGSFSVQKVIADRDVTLSVYAADLDGDGDLDVIAGLDQVGFVWYENAGNGTFGAEQLIGTNYATMSVYANDLDSDGDMDVIGVSYTNGKVVWYE